MANDTWRDRYPNYRSSNLDFYSSDHRPVCISFNRNTDAPNRSHRFKKSFTFEHKWILEEDFDDFVKKHWESTEGAPNLDQKLNILANTLTRWAKDNIGSLQTNIKTTMARICQLEGTLSNNQNCEEINRLKVTLENLLYKEEIHWHQRARNN